MAKANGDGTSGNAGPSVTVYKKFLDGDLNPLSGGITRNHPVAKDAISSIKGAAQDAHKTTIIADTGPYRAQVLLSFADRPPIGGYTDYGGTQIQPPLDTSKPWKAGIGGEPLQVPWIVARINELMAHLPDPADYDPNGTPSQQLKYWEAIKAHFDIGIFLPEFLEPNYPLPAPGSIVKVDYINTRGFKGGTYKYLGATSTGGQQLLSGPGTPGHQLAANWGGGAGAAIVPTVTEEGKYASPFSATAQFEMQSPWARDTRNQPHTGLDLVVLNTIVNGRNVGGLSEPILTIGRARITEIKDNHPDPRLSALYGPGGRDASKRGTLLTEYNYEAYCNAFGRRCVNAGDGILRVKRSGASLAPTPEGIISGYSGQTATEEFTSMPIKMSISRIPTSIPGFEQIQGSNYAYGDVYFFTTDHGSSRTGTKVQYELLEGAIPGTVVRNFHMGAVSPVLKAAFELAKSTGGELVVSQGTEIGLMGCQAVMDSAPHLHIDFGPKVGDGRIDPACYIQLGNSGDYWCYGSAGISDPAAQGVSEGSGADPNRYPWS